MKNSALAGHLAAFATVLIWGTTFISTKLLLADFQPVEILFIRFVLGMAALWAVSPRPLKTTGAAQELTFAAAGLCGICLYYLLENIALTYTMASNVGVIIAVAPFFTAILSRIFLRSEERLGLGFFAGLAAALAGIGLISFNGASLQVNPFGDFLAFCAAVVWAGYSILSRKISSYGYPVVCSTRKIFFYGILFMIPALFAFGFELKPQRFLQGASLFHMLYLGFGASALCFVTWNFAVRVLGAVKTSVYIYLDPVITVAASALFLGEPVTVLSGLGTALTLAGLLLSQMRTAKKA